MGKSSNSGPDLTGRTAAGGPAAGPAELAEAPAAALPAGRGLQALERLTKLSAALFDCEAAVLLFNQAGVSRIVCGHGITAHFLSYRWDYGMAPYAPDERFLVADATHRDDVQHASAFIGGRRAGFFLRWPVSVATTHTLTLIVIGTEAKSEPEPTELRVLDDIVALMTEEFRDIEPLLADASAHVSVAEPYQALVERVERMTVPGALIDAAGTIVAANAQLADVLLAPRDHLIGRTHGDVAPRFAPLLAQFFARALADKVSTPAIEVTAEGPDGEAPRTYAVVGSPLSPIGTDDYFLLVTVSDISTRVAREDQIDTDVERAPARAARPPEPSARFLMETLVGRRTIRNRNSISYLTIRSWRQPLRKFQIAALLALKGRVPAEFADGIAGEIAEGVGGLVGTAAFKTVVPVPCGHSSPEGECLSVAIGRSLAAQLGLPMVQAIESQRLKGSSHPKTNAKRPPMALAHKVDGPVLLVDDVATSGAHLQEAVELIKPHCGSVLPVAWIGGDAKGDD